MVIINFNGNRLPKTDGAFMVLDCGEIWSAVKKMLNIHEAKRRV